MKTKRKGRSLHKEPIAFTYMSFGAGVQSSYLLVCSALGLHGCPKADVGLFADTQVEPFWVYEHLEVMTRWAREHGMEVARITRGHMGKVAVGRHDGTESRFANIPLWTLGDDGREAPLRRQCTREFKIEVMQQEVRRRLGYQPRQKNRHHVRCLIGISLDEMGRMASSIDRWITNEYPLVDARLTRGDCERGLREHGLPVPKKSSCVFCPYHDDVFWADLKENHPTIFEEACWYDEQLRDMTRSGLERKAFVHRSLKPLREVDFLGRIRAEEANRIPLFAALGDLNGDCGGHCGQ